MTITVPESDWRLSLSSGTKYKLLSSSGTFTDEEATATEVVIIKAQNLGDFVRHCIPGPFESLGTLVYPGNRLMPGTPLMTKRISWQSNVDGKPVDPFLQDTAAPDGTYEGDLRLTIEYGTSPLNDLADSGGGSDPNDPRTFLEISANASGDFISTPVKGTAKWEGVNTTFGESDEVKEQGIPHVITSSEVEWTCRWSQIPHNFMNSVLMSRLRSKLGFVNNATMPMFYNAPAETILFLGYSIQQQFTWRSGLGGQPPVNIEFKFLEKNFTWVTTQVTHNHFWRPGWGWRRLLVDGVNPTYKSTNLTNIFAP